MECRKAYADIHYQECQDSYLHKACLFQLLDHLIERMSLSGKNCHVAKDIQKILRIKVVETSC